MVFCDGGIELPTSSLALSHASQTAISLIERLVVDPRYHSTTSETLLDPSVTGELPPPTVGDYTGKLPPPTMKNYLTMKEIKT